MKITVIGGGIVGLAVARELHRTHSGAEIVLLEKEADFGRHQSTHNSGVLHAGLYYRPGSLKARLAVAGIRQMAAFCAEQGIPHEICGKLVLATSEEESVRLRGLLERGRQNGLRGLVWLEREAVLEREPNAGGTVGLLVPEEGIVDYAAVCAALARENRRLGTQLVNHARVTHCRREGSRWQVASTAVEVSCDYIINCAGLHCDRVAQQAGEAREARIIPFRGEYYRLKPSAEGLVRNLIYPVPDPVFPFLGVHFTRMIGGGVEAGPNAVLALAREGYTKWDINLSDLADALTYRGLWRFFGRHRSMVVDEIKRALSRRLFCQSLQRLVPAIQESDMEAGGAGVRAQAMDPQGGLLQDFAFIQRPDALHLINAPSPAATASLAIAEEIARQIPHL